MFVHRTIVLRESAFLNFVFGFLKYLKETKVSVMHLSVRSGDD